MIVSLAWVQWTAAAVVVALLAAVPPFVLAAFRTWHLAVLTSHHPWMRQAPALVQQPQECCPAAAFPAALGCFPSQISEQHRWTVPGAFAVSPWVLLLLSTAVVVAPPPDVVLPAAAPAAVPSRAAVLSACFHHLWADSASVSSFSFLAPRPPCLLFHLASIPLLLLPEWWKPRPPRS